MNNSSTAFKTDFYELTMLQAALQSGRAFDKATFDLFARKLPSGRRYGVVAGIGRAIQAVKDFHFTEDQLTYLDNHPVILPETVEYLRNYRFTGKITGYREGDVYFPNSPILTVEGFFGDSVLLETVLLSILNHDSAVASAASRMVVAANGIPLIEMGSRRTHEAAAIDSARAAYIAGFKATSNTEAGLRYGVPTSGTSAHAFTLAFKSEVDAFQAQVNALGTETTLLVDTYDIPQGIRNAVAVAGINLGGIRIDSGDLHEETVNARKLLDELGAVNTKIILSSDIDEYTISALLEQNVPVDGVGAGTRVVTGSGHPTASMVFKLVEREDEDGEMIPVAKKASGKKSIGGLKTAYRTYDENGIITEEFFTFDGIPENDKNLKDAVPLQIVYVKDGEYHIPTVEDARAFHKLTLETLPEDAKLILAGTAAFESLPV
jgi:putative nicotinate phosphoribosyltransferase